MPTVVGVAFRPVTKVYYFDPQGLDDLRAGRIRRRRNVPRADAGTGRLRPREVSEEEVAGTLKPVVRRATAWDMVQADQMAHREPEALQIAVGRGRRRWA